MHLTRAQYQAALRRPRTRTTALLVAAVLGVTIGGVVSTLPSNAVAPVVSGTCKLVVPPNPTSATGLATPWQIGSGCTQSNANMRVFVQAAILSPDGTSVSVYDPLVVDAGTVPFAPEVVPTIAPGSTVGIWVGGNDVTTQLVGAGRGSCVNGIGGPGVGNTSAFGQVAACNAVAWFAAANAAIAAGHLVVPPLGHATNGDMCPTVRDYRIVDQDPSDNTQTVYLLAPNGQTAQNTAANRAAFPTAVAIKNPSDNALLTKFVDPAIGCHAWSVPDVTDAGEMSYAQPLDELQAAAYQAAPLGYVPLGDEMTEIGTTENVQKTDLYRSLVDQPPVSPAAPGDDTTYCTNLLAIAPPFFKAHESEFLAKASPLPDVANSLWTFVTNRFVGTYEQLFHVNCTTISGPDPVHVVYDANGVAVSATVS